MALKLYDDTNVQAIANAIRSKNFQSTTYKISEMASAISALQTGLELLPQDTAEGSIANFPDGSNGYPVVSLEADIVATQAGSGDPSPSNVREISGFTECKVTRAGKNLFDYTAQGIDDGHYYDNFGVYKTNSGWLISAPIELTQGLTYYGFDFMKGGTQAGANIYNSNDQLVRTITIKPNVQMTFTAQEGESYIKLSVRKSLDEYLSAIFTNSADIYTISFGEAGTVYGGSLNVTTGVLTIDKYFVDMGTVSYNQRTENEIQLNKETVRTTTGKDPKRTTSAFFLCEIFASEILQTANAWRFTTSVLATDAPTTFSGKKLVYELATPETIQLTPEQVKTVLGENNIFATTGDVDVTYRADVDLYIQKKINEGT